MTSLLLDIDIAATERMLVQRGLLAPDEDHSLEDISAGLAALIKYLSTLSTPELRKLLGRE